MTVQAIPIVQIRTDGGTQVRTSTYFDKIEEYTQAMLDGAAFPPLTVFWDGAEYWLADGFHRLEALAAVAKALRRRRYAVECEVIEGGQREAILYACGANDAHGIQRTPDDKRAAIKTVLENPLVSTNPETGLPWVNAEIARICNVSPHTVAKVRPKDAVLRAQNCNSYERNGKAVNRVKGSSGKKSKAAPKTQDQTAAPSPPLGSGEPDRLPFKQSTEWDHLFTLIRRIDEAVGGLPAPEVAAANFPISLAHALPIARVVEIQRWWQEFTRFWAARDPEIQKHRQSVRDFIQEQEAASVAAE
jgi:hypothetical protein